MREQVLGLQAALDRSAASGLSAGPLSEVYGRLGQAYHGYRLLGPAECCYRNALLLAPKDPRWTYLLADVCRLDGRLQDAELHYRQALALDPRLLAAHVRLGDAYVQQNRLEAAQRAYEAALSLDLSCAAALAGLGQVALSRKDYAGAVARFEAALALVPAANRLHIPLAMAYRGLGEVPKAIQHLLQRGAVGVTPPDPLLDEVQALAQGERLAVLRGRNAFQAGRYAEAAAEFRKAVEAEPESVPARVNLGSALGLLGDTAGAIEQYREALRLDPKLASAHFNLGALLGKQGRLDEAAGHFEAALASNPDDLQAHLELAAVRNKAGRCADAVAALRRALALAERLGEARTAQGLRRTLTAIPEPCP